MLPHTHTHTCVGGPSLAAGVGSAFSGCAAKSQPAGTTQIREPPPDNSKKPRSKPAALSVHLYHRQVMNENLPA